jgi:hypothetical protein
MDKQDVFLVLAITGMIVLTSLMFVYVKPALLDSPPPYLVSTLIGNISDPSPRYTSPYGYVSPNLWSFGSGEGGAVMSLYSNGSVHTSINLYGPKISIFGYPSIHFTYGLPLSLQSVYDGNLSSFISFSITNTSKGIVNDVIYDIFLGMGNTLQDEIEIVLFDNTGTKSTMLSGTGTLIEVPMKINGKLENVRWQLENGISASGSFPDYAFMPDITFNNSSSYTVYFSPFLHFLQNTSRVSPNVSIVRLGIGSEFGGGISPESSKLLGYDSFDYSFWMYSYFVMNGTEYQVVPTIIPLAILSEVG